MDGWPGGLTPYFRMYGKELATVLLPFGCEVFYLLEKSGTEKFAVRAARGVFLGHGQMGAVYMLNFERYVEDKAVRVLTTSGVQVNTGVFPCKELQLPGEDQEKWSLRGGTEFVGVGASDPNSVNLMTSHIVLGIKGVELSQEWQTWKERLVGEGDRIVNGNGTRVSLTMHHRAPAQLMAIRFLYSFGRWLRRMVWRR